MKDSLDNRYSQALFSLAKEENKVLDYQKEMKDLNKLFIENEEFFKLLKSEFISLTKRFDVIDNILKVYSLTIKNFLKVLIQNHRLNAFNSIFSSFNSLCNDENNVMEGIIYSTIKLEEEKIHQIEDALSKKNNVRVELINKIDTALIGGVKVAINNHVYDYSISSELSNMRVCLNK